MNVFTSDWFNKAFILHNNNKLSSEYDNVFILIPYIPPSLINSSIIYIENSLIRDKKLLLVYLGILSINWNSLFPLLNPI